MPDIIANPGFMNITIIGAGAMGTLFAGLLASKNRISILEKNYRISEKIAKHGIRIIGKTALTLSPDKFDVITDARGIRSSDIVVISVKSYDTVAVLKSIRRYICKKTFVMTLQNGFGNYENILKYVEKNSVICGTTSHGAVLIDCGVVRHTGCGETVMGYTEGVEKVADNFNGCGIYTRTVKNIDSVMWSKLAINCAINPVGAISEVTNGEIIKYPGLIEVALAAGKEVVTVASKSGINMLFDDVSEKIYEVCKNTSGNINSMLADVIAGRRTEIDFLNGAVVKKAEELGVKVPVNEALRDMIKKIRKNSRCAKGN